MNLLRQTTITLVAGHPMTQVADHLPLNTVYQRQTFTQGDGSWCNNSTRRWSWLVYRSARRVPRGSKLSLLCVLGLNSEGDEARMDTSRQHLASVWHGCRRLERSCRHWLLGNARDDEKRPGRWMSCAEERLSSTWRRAPRNTKHYGLCRRSSRSSTPPLLKRSPSQSRTRAVGEEASVRVLDCEGKRFHK